MQIVKNTRRGRGLSADVEMARGIIRTSAEPVRAMLAACPVHGATPLVDATGLAAEIGIASLRIKDERQRMGLGSFKALGGAYAVACAVKEEAEQVLARALEPAELTSQAVRDAVGSLHVLCASAGNHGLSVAAGARVFGVKASVYLSESVPEGFAERLRGIGATVVRAGAIYEESMAAAELASRTDGVLISDSTWPGYVDPALVVLEGYTVLAAETVEEMDPPTHIFLQAGVGGMASAVAATLRASWGDEPTIVVVEPEAAPCLLAGVEAGKPVAAAGPVSSMGRLDCKDPSHVALEYLAREADFFLTMSDDQCGAAVATIAERGFESSPSGAAGLAALMTCDAGDREVLGLSGDSRVLAIMSEGAV